MDSKIEGEEFDPRLGVFVGKTLSNCASLHLWYKWVPADCGGVGCPYSIGTELSFRNEVWKSGIVHLPRLKVFSQQGMLVLIAVLVVF